MLDLRRESYVTVKGLFEVRLIVFFLRGLVDCVVSLKLGYLLVCFIGFCKLRFIVQSLRGKVNCIVSWRLGL